MKEDFSHLLVGVDDSADAQLAFRYAMYRAKKDKLKMTIVSILEKDEMNVYQALNKDFIHGKREDLEKHVQLYKKTALDYGVEKVEAIVAEGEPGETIVKDIIPHTDADLLIVGSEDKKGIAKHFGSQAAYMSKYATISVLVVR
ncbi:MULTISPECIES: universal stress protein [Sporolactobacillus]|uniref:Universal stress protein family n=3 Tax=Sporolactobacillus TaxID=2077 RepID=A0A4Y3T9G7_9BACL|nr:MULTISPECIES: universal stress protein [Sporolactobacillus]KLI01934.1 universal stress protein UspA [Sporolactobacillus inulinus CASD]QAA23214.1 universal stress protein UspC [Sporolactobacillus terrae]QAA26184.1 universal stress protein UspC [Sporolactobacillus terrae]UAK15281.1 universal stress protein [Sporolactobacillus terrae]BBN99614.1 universal stress protein UspA [Sporolactobacillus terrae]